MGLFLKIFVCCLIASDWRTQISIMTRKVDGNFQPSSACPQIPKVLGAVPIKTRELQYVITRFLVRMEASSATASKRSRRDSVCGHISRLFYGGEKKQTRLSLNPNSSSLPCSLRGCGFHFTLRTTVSSVEELAGCCELLNEGCGFLMMLASSSSRSCTMVSVESSPANCVGEAARGAWARACL